MATVKVRFEKSKTPGIDHGMIYYRIYKGHNNRFEFSAHIKIKADEWDDENKTILGDHNEFNRLKVEKDVKLLKMIIDSFENSKYCDTYKAIEVADKFRKIKSII